MTSGTAIVTWDGVDAPRLAELCAVSRLELLAETDSTQNVAHALAEAGATSGTVVLADAQRAGRGRMGRSWSSEPGAGVWCTIIERPTADVVEVLSLRVGLYAAELLDRLAGEQVMVKWPNDLVIPGAPGDLRLAKLGGILVEARWLGQSLAWVAIGVGVNVVAPTDVAHAGGMAAGARRRDVLTAIVRATRAAAAQRGVLTPDELQRFAARDALAGRRILSPMHGIAVGINAGGELRVETSRGVEHVRAGTVELAHEMEEPQP